MVLGDFIVTSEIVRILLVDTKMDSIQTRPMCLFHCIRSTEFFLLVNAALVTRIDVSLSQEIRGNMSSIPIMFRTPVGSFVDVSSSKISYNEFLI